MHSTQKIRRRKEASKRPCPSQEKNSHPKRLNRPGTKRSSGDVAVLVWEKPYFKERVKALYARGSRREGERHKGGREGVDRNVLKD